MMKYGYYLSTVSLILSLVIAETVFYFMTDRSELDDIFTVYDENIGYKAEPGVHRVIFVKNNDVIYNVTYTVGDDNNRITSPCNGSIEAYFFGGSYTFGQGLEDAETLPYIYSDLTGECTKNMAGSGYGPEMMLSQLRESHVQGKVFYIYIPDHIRRVNGDVRHREDRPYYDNSLEFKGLLEDARPFQTWIQRTIRKTNTWKYLRFSYPPTDEEDIIKTAEIIIESSRHVDGSFYVVKHPLSRKDELTSQLFSYLIESNISVIEPSIVYEPAYVIAGDGHPSGMFNNLFAESLISSAQFS